MGWDPPQRAGLEGQVISNRSPRAETSPVAKVHYRGDYVRLSPHQVGGSADDHVGRKGQGTTPSF